ncbi:5-formyltetrahydrofolate cyclo-ligase [Gallaecimonas sp. GXIMD1310]|uniref:5-formyltetrahydrofolate cyclo-ligase n=1 Tax=Gallaecimonas sp. GXIMD1310 TaxID=3131926 RepID=UPI00324BBD1A
MHNRDHIRQWARDRRRALTPQQQQHTAGALAEQALAQPSIMQARTLALYLANDGEADPAILMQALHAAGKQVLLPVLHPFSSGYLLFQSWHPGMAMTRNRFNIAEPPLSAATLVPVKHIDVVFTPLVAFDEQGNRLGMGGGFYDRSLAAFQGLTVGLAHDCQQYPALPAAAWDKPLDMILTASQVKRFRY